MFSLFQKHKDIHPRTLQEAIDEVITPVAKGWGMEKKGDYLWYSPGDSEIRFGLQYSFLKGNQGTLTWGLCLNYVPLISGNTLKFYRTGQSFKIHLFEWTDEYANSFMGGKMNGGVVNHSIGKRTAESLEKLLKAYSPKIEKWMANTHTIDGIIKCTESQIDTGKYYNLHSPNPKYILPFLYAKNHLVSEAQAQFELFDLSYFNDSDEIRDKVQNCLLGLSH